MEPRTVPDEGRRTAARFLPGGDLAGSIYGIILVSALLVTYQDNAHSAGEVIAWLLVTTFVFASAHAWSKTLADSAGVDRVRRLRGEIRHEWPIVQAAVPSCVIVGLASLDAWGLADGIWAAICLNVGLLFVWGAALRNIEGGTRLQTFLAGLASAGFGLVFVLLKVFVH